MVFQDLVILASILIACYIRYLFEPFDVFTAQKLLNILILLSVIKISFHYFDLYEIYVHISFREFILSLLKALLITLVVLTVLYYIYHPIVIGRGILAITVIMILILVTIYRWIYYYFSEEASFTQNLLILGTGPAAKSVIDEVEKYEFSGYNVMGIIDDDPKLLGDKFEGYKVIGNSDQLLDLAEARDVNTVVVAMSEQRGRLPISALMDCKLRGIKVVNDTMFHEQFTGKIMVENLRPSFFIFSDGFKISKFILTWKRVFDVAMSLLLLIFSLPLILITGMAVLLTSRGPILYRQERVGRFGKIFNLYKFRSMYAGSEDKTGPVWAQKNDSRVTPVGRIIRRSRIDELPQIYNILRGDMSFVGPRPERPFFVDQLIKEISYYKQRFVIKPGLTGWAQIRFPYGNTVEDAKEKLQYDLYYIKNVSPLFDLRIISETTKVILGRMGEGVY